MNNLIGDSQHGFRHNHSCLTYLLDFFEQVKDTYDADNNKAAILVYMYFQKTDTWILGVVSKQLRPLHGRVGDSTTSVNSLSPQMSELVEDAIAS